MQIMKVSIININFKMHNYYSLSFKSGQLVLPLLETELDILR